MVSFKIACLLSLATLFISANATAQEQSPKIKYDLYVEFLCPDCRKFITKSIGKAIQTPGFLDIAELNFNPYGNGHIDKNGKVACQHGPKECYGNMLVACGDSYIPNRPNFYNFVICLEKNTVRKHPDFETALNKCTETYNDNTRDNIAKCANGNEGEQLALVVAKKTDSLVPIHTEVPWVTVNGKFDNTNKDLAVKDLLALTCKLYDGSNKIEACIQKEQPQAEKEQPQLVQQQQPQVVQQEQQQAAQQPQVVQEQPQIAKQEQPQLVQQDQPQVVEQKDPQIAKEPKLVLQQ